MGTEILKSYGALQTELDNARSTLKGVDENIKRLIGRDPSEIVPRNAINKRVVTMVNNPDEPRTKQQRNIVPGNGGMGSSLNRRVFYENNGEPPQKRRPPGSVFRRLADKPLVHPEPEEMMEPVDSKRIISKVIVTPREVPSRQDALAAQKSDAQANARNRRIFGALLGTLQKFRQEETKMKVKEEKRAEVEKRIEEHEIKEKAEIRKERQELFQNRKRKQAEIKMIELKMARMQHFAKWEEQQKPLLQFIQTKAKPHIFYMPKQLNDVNKIAHVETRTDLEKMINSKRQDVFDELKHIEERMNRNFDQRMRRGEVPPVRSEVKRDQDKMNTSSESSDEDDEANKPISSEVSIPHDSNTVKSDGEDIQNGKCSDHDKQSIVESQSEMGATPDV